MAKSVAAARYEEAIKLVQKFVPEFRVVEKHKSRLHRILGWIAAKIGNPAYMHSIWTTVGYTVGRPEIARYRPLDREWQVILHEGKHALDAKKLTRPVFLALYLSPQIFAVCSLLAALAPFFGWSYLWWLASLVCLAPMPSLFRGWLEYRAYVVSLLIQRSYSGKGLDIMIQNLAELLSGPVYYHAWPIEGITKRLFDRFLKKVKDRSAKLGDFERECEKLAAKYRREDGI